MNKVYTYRNTYHKIAELSKWLRQNGQPYTDYTIHQANYKQLTIEFHNTELELMYTLQFDWANDYSDKK